jgi:hypothetical protein
MKKEQFKRSKNSEKKEVKMMKKGLLLGMMFLLALVLTVPAQAALLVDDWQIDLSGIDGLAAGPAIGSTQTGIEQIIFTGVSHQVIVVDAVAGSGPSPGDISIFDGHLGSSSYKFNDGTQGPAPQFGGLNIAYEITYDVTDVAQTISVDPVSGTSTQVHLPAGTYGGETSDNLLEIWVDNLTDAVGVQSSTVSGDGYTDGVMVARLINPPEPGDGGSFTPVGLDGSDDATFKLNKVLCPSCFMLAGVFFGDINGDGILEDLSLFDGVINPAMVTAVLTDNNFDGDADDNGTLDTPMPTNWATYFPTRTGISAPPGNVTAFYGSNDGSASPAIQIPEPSTMILFVFGLLSLGLYSRNRMKK